MADSKSRVLIGRQLDVTLDREMLREVIGNLAKPGGTQEWCIACGAGKDASPLDKVNWVQDSSRDLLQGKTLQEFVNLMKDIGPQAWCIACGAGKDASPLDRLVNPAELPDDVIDALARRLISAVSVG
jgi:hypothetical protein